MYWAAVWKCNKPRCTSSKTDCIRRHLCGDAAARSLRVKQGEVEERRWTVSPAERCRGIPTPVWNKRRRLVERWNGENEPRDWKRCSPSSLPLLSPPPLACTTWNNCSVFAQWAGRGRLCFWWRDLHVHAADKCTSHGYGLDVMNICYFRVLPQPPDCRVQRLPLRHFALK